jgi:hypothetical protein
MAAGLACGLGAGTKMSMLPPALLLTLAAAWMIFRHPDFWLRDPNESHLVHGNHRLALRHAAILFGSMLPGCFYWYLRNLIHFGNPFYPVALAGLPGYDMKAILPIDPAFREDPWARLLDPWQELAYGSPYDDGMGAVFAAIVIPALFFWWLLGRRRESGLAWFLTAGALGFFALSNTSTPRYGIFAILISFLLVGELWTAVHSRALRALTWIAVAIPTLVFAQALVGGILFDYLKANPHGAARYSLPAVVDQAPAGRILNAGLGAYHTYGLLGADVRHDVVTLFHRAEPADVERFHVNYVLVADSRIPEFTAGHRLEPLGAAGGVTFFRVAR